MSGTGARSVSGSRIAADTQAADFNAQWLALLSWQLLFVDGEIDRYRVHVPGCSRRWLIARSTPRAADSGLRRIEHEFSLASRLEPAWALVPRAGLHMPEGPLLVYDDVGGRSLYKLSDGTLSIRRFLKMAAGAARALAQAHGAGVLHRDVKPSNLHHGGDGVVRLSGFGVSVIRRPGEQPPMLDSISGTLAYMAPEQARAVERQADERSDLYALGMTFYEWLCGQLPFEASDPVEWVYCHVARQPPSPTQFRPSIPAPLATLVLKLIAKNPAERYQNASSLEADLRACLAQWNESQHIAAFDPALSAQGSEGKVLLDRTQELQALHKAYARVAQSGHCEWVLLSGAAGAGKSTLVRQLQQDLATSRVLFAVGKFEQSRHSTPYACLAQALRSLMMRVLGERAEALQRWREKLSQALCGHAGLIANLVPEIELILGPQTPFAEVPVKETRNLFNLLLQRLLSCFASTDRPLVVFFDDLQWLDEATLSFIVSLHTPRYQNILLLGAYRDNEIAECAVFCRYLDRLRQAATGLTEIPVLPLTLDSVVQWVARLLQSEPDSIRPLARLIHEKTGGNPLFVAQLLRTFLDEQLIVSDHPGGTWRWDAWAIQGQRYAENVIDLMVARIARLPAQTRICLGQMACIGSRVDTPTLCRVSQLTPHALRQHLAAAVEAGLVVEDRRGFGFYHDRVQESAYSLTPPARRPVEHLRIARVMLSELDGEGRHDQVFQIASHVQRIALHEPHAEEGQRFVALLVRAAQQAMASGAIPAALHYLHTAKALTGLHPTTGTRDLSEDIGVLQAQCLILEARFEPAAQLIAELLEQVESLVRRAALYMLKVELLVLSSRYRDAIVAGREGLQMFGIHLAVQVDDRQVEQAYRYLLDTRAERSIDSLAELPLMHNASFEAAMGMLASMIGPASFIDARLLFVLTCEMVQLSLEYGVCSVSPHGLAWFGVVLADKYAAHEDGEAYARAARAMVLKRGYSNAESATLVALDQVSVWTRPLGEALGYARAAFASGHQAGNLTMSCYACNHIVSNLLVMGEYLERVAEEVANGLEFAARAGFRDVEAALHTQSRFVGALRHGKAGARNTLAPEQQALDALGRDCAMTPVAFWWWLFEGISHYLYRDFSAATACLEKAGDLAWSTPAHVHLLEYHCFTALNLAAGCRTGDDPARTLADMAPHLDKLEQWAALNPLTFKDKALLVQAEMARLNGNVLKAIALYEAAVSAAVDAGFVHMQALAHELAGECHQSSGLPTSARSHLRSARDCYQRWGAHGKVADLDARWGFLREQAPQARPSISLWGGQVSLDLVSVMKASQALSEEILLDRLIGTLLTNTILHAGAQQALLLLVKQDAPQIVARGREQESGIAVDLASMTPSSQHLPLSMLYTVMRTRQLITLDDAAQSLGAAEDEYFRGRTVRSVLCLPLVKQGRVIGVLYLENNLTPGVFTGQRTAVLELLAGQAAISLETARLYAELIDENARRRQTETALRNARAELAKVSQATVMGELAASIAHEINQPLASIVSNASASVRWLNRTTPVVGEALAGLRDIVNDGKRAADIVRALQSLARQTPANRRLLSVNEVIDQVVLLTAGEIEQRHVQLSRTCSETQLNVEADSVQLQQVILNLIMNAVEALGDVEGRARRLSIGCEAVGNDYVAVSVQDNANGVEPAMIERIFEAFFTTKEQGMGMGLAICRSIIDSHGGSLYVFEGRGQGTLFVFTLPA